MKYASEHGNLNRLTHGINYQGQVCGVDPNVSDSPFLFWCRKPQPAVGMPSGLNMAAPVCVATCPTVFTTQVFCPMASEVTTQQVNSGIAQQMITTIVQKQVLVDAYPARVLGARYCMPDMPWNHTMEFAVKSGPEGQMITRFVEACGSLTDVPYLFVGVAIGACVMGFVYLLCLKCFTSFLVWSSIYGSSLILLLLGAGFLLTAQNLTGRQADSPLYKEYEPEQAHLYSLILGGVSAGIGFLILCLACCLRSSIDLACKSVESACECLFHMPTLLLHPVLVALLKICVFLACLGGLLLLVSCGNMESAAVTLGEHTVSGVGRSFQYTDEEKYFLVYYIFGLMWIMELLNALSLFTVSYAVCLWYYSAWDDKSGEKRAPLFAVFRGIFNALFFHFGSMAFGAFVLALLKGIRIILLLMSRAAKNDNNKILACLLDACQCCMACLEGGVAFVSRNAYIEVAINSKPYCQAAREAYGFMLAEADEVVILSGATFLIQVFGCLGICAAGGFMTYQVVTTQEKYTSDLSPHYVGEPEFVAGVAAAMCFSISIVFMDILDQCAETLLFVYATSANDGTADYLLSDTMRSLVNHPAPKVADQARNMTMTAPAGQVAPSSSAYGLLSWRRPP